MRTPVCEAWVEFAPLLTRVQAVTPIEDICERRARVLQVRLNGVGADFIGPLERALASHRGGTTPVRLAYRNADGEAEIELGAEWCVRASPALRQNVEAMPGVLAAELLFN